MARIMTRTAEPAATPHVESIASEPVERRSRPAWIDPAPAPKAEPSPKGGKAK